MPRRGHYHCCGARVGAASFSLIVPEPHKNVEIFEFCTTESKPYRQGVGVGAASISRQIYIVSLNIAKLYRPPAQLANPWVKIANLAYKILHNIMNASFEPCCHTHKKKLELAKFLLTKNVQKLTNMAIRKLLRTGFILRR
jgi:hypothetical protein